MMQLWIVGQWRAEGWELQGVFSTKERAVAACTGETYFVGPVLLDMPLPAESTDWPGAYYPLASRILEE